MKTCFSRPAVAGALLFSLPAAPSAAQECNLAPVTDDATAIISALQQNCRPGDKVLLTFLPQSAAVVVVANSCAFDRQIFVIPGRKPMFGRHTVDLVCIYPRAPR
jgi:hypothetical protein